ncbi:hypothetical protein PUN28_014335 [Cardiocondyla obscurior]|uniref:Uncharacterized protein n=1 Tax=Cardiocondyla obscurior TaxID=286306 RepID=A0AAW2F4N4_9HYME
MGKSSVSLARHSLFRAVKKTAAGTKYPRVRRQKKTTEGKSVDPERVQRGKEFFFLEALIGASYRKKISNAVGISLSLSPAMRALALRPRTSQLCARSAELTMRKGGRGKRRRARRKTCTSYRGALRHG